jgi:hypothetical protein
MFWNIPRITNKIESIEIVSTHLTGIAVPLNTFLHNFLKILHNS